MWLLSVDDFVLAEHNIPSAMITNESSHLGFGVDRRAGVATSVFFGAQAAPATWSMIFQCPDDASRYALIAVLAAKHDDQFYLVADRAIPSDPDDLVTTWGAVTSVTPVGSSWNLKVTFESNDSVWLSQTPATTSYSFNWIVGEILHVPVTGDVPTYPLLRVVPTAQRTGSGDPAAGWKYRQRWTITNNGTETLFRYPVRIVLGSTTALVSGGKALASGNDFRVWLDGIEQSRTVYGWNTGATYVWVVIPALIAGASLTYDLVYGNPGASTPPVLAYPDLPAFDMSVSANDFWTYRAGPGTTYAGQGIWALSAATGAFFADYGVPGAWHRELLYGDDTTVVEQRGRHQVYGTARFGVVRGGGDTYNAEAIGLTGKDPYDTVVLSHPLGVTTLTTSFSYIAWSYAMVTQTVTTVVGSTSTSSDVEVKSYQNPTMFRLAIAARGSGSQEWADIFSTGASTETSPGSGVYAFQTIASAAYTINAKHVAMAVWPNTGDNTVHATDQQGYFYAVTFSDLVIGINSGVLGVAQTQAETQIYEIASEFRIGGGGLQNGNKGVGGIVGPYRTVLIGNARRQSGAGTPRAAVAFGPQALAVDCETHVVSVVDATYPTKIIEQIPAHAVRAMRGYLHNGVTSEIATTQWLPLTPARRTVPNGAFATNLDYWQTNYFASPGITFTIAHDPAAGAIANGSIKINVTAAASSGVIYILHTTQFPLYGAESVDMTGWIRASTAVANVGPWGQLWIRWLDLPITTEIANDTSNTFDVFPSQWYDMALTGWAPPNAGAFQLGLIVNVTAGHTGTVWFDDVRINDSDLYCMNVYRATETISAIATPRWVP